MGGCGEEKLWLAQGKALRDPRPDVPHLLGTDYLWRKGVGVKSQLDVPPGDDVNTNKGRDREGQTQRKITVSDLINLQVIYRG